MSETFTVTGLVNFMGEKPNPHGGVLYKFKVSLTDEAGTLHEDCYWQRKSRELEPGEKVYGHIEQGEYGPRFKTDQRPDGNFQAPSYEREAGPRGASSAVKTPADSPQGSRTGGFQEERSRRIERQHSQDMSLRLLALSGLPEHLTPDALKEVITFWTDWFVQDLDVELGSGQAAHGASSNDPSVAEDAADLSLEANRALAAFGAGELRESSLPVSQTGGYVEQMKDAGMIPPNERQEEASPAQKGTLTKLFHEAGLSREAMKAVVLFRCGSEKATKQGASQLITDLQDGATHDALLAEIYDAHRAGNPLGTRAAALIPTEVPWEDDGSLPEPSAKDESGVPF